MTSLGECELCQGHLPFTSSSSDSTSQGLEVHAKCEDSTDDEHGNSYTFKTRANQISHMLEVQGVPPDLFQKSPFRRLLPRFYFGRDNKFL